MKVSVIKRLPRKRHILKKVLPSRPTQGSVGDIAGLTSGHSHTPDPRLALSSCRPSKRNNQTLLTNCKYSNINDISAA